MKKKIIAFGLVVAMLAIAVVSGTLAYFTDSDEATNTFTVGNVKIQLVEQQSSDAELVEFDQNKLLMPGVAQDKFVSVKNVGNNDAYVRVTYTIPDELVGVIEIEMPNEINGYSYTRSADGTAITCIFTNPVKSEATENVSPIILAKVKLVESFDWIVKPIDGVDTVVGYKCATKTVETETTFTLDTTVDVKAEAIQAVGFNNVTEAFEAFDKQTTPAVESETIDGDNA